MQEAKPKRPAAVFTVKGGSKQSIYAGSRMIFVHVKKKIKGLIAFLFISISLSAS